MAANRVYTFESGDILRHGAVVGTYDPVTHQILGLDEGLPKNVPAIIAGMLAGLDKPKGKPPHPIVIPPGEIEFVEEDRTQIIPPPPEMDPKYGDKTPAYIEWMRKWHPEEAAKRYHVGRKLDMNAKPPTEGDIPESSITEEAPEVWLRK